MKFLKLLGVRVDGDDMEPVDLGAQGAAFPPPTVGGRPTAPPVPDRSQAGSRPTSLFPAVKMIPMFPWRLAGAVALALVFGLLGWEVLRLIDGQPWSDSIMFASIAAAVVAGASVLGWTWTTVRNARRLVEPAKGRELPDPVRAVVAWLVPFGFVGIAVAVVALLGEQASATSDETVSSIPLAVAVVSLLLAIPMTYRPLHVLSNVVRQIGGHSAKLAQWMWVPVVLGLVGVGSILALRFGGAISDSGYSIESTGQWVPLWVVAVVAIAPCVIVLLLGWRAAATVEEAVLLAAERRSGRPSVKPATLGFLAAARDRGHRESLATRKRVRLIPGADLLRLGIVTTLAGLALLSVVGAAVMGMFWLQSDDGVLTPSQRTRAWDALDVLHSGVRVVGFALLALTCVWTFVAVANVRFASGRRRNPLLAAAAWPAAAVAFWMIADRMIVDGSIGEIVLGFAAQAAVLYVPFRLLERAAAAVDARRTPVRMAFMAGVVLTVYMQALGGLTTFDASTTTTTGRLAAFLALGALLQLLSTLAVTEACRTIENATEHEAELTNALVAQREAVTRRHADAGSVAGSVMRPVS
jgi:hypothetical protein